MIERKTWKEFRDSSLLWWINRSLHLFGWAIVVEVDNSGAISDVYPARMSHRGFDLETETEGFTTLTKYLNNNSDQLLEEISNDE